MNDKQKTELLESFKKLNTKYGKGSIYTIDSTNSIKDILRWSTGISSLDEIIGGGIPYRIVEVYGVEGCIDKDTFINYEIRYKSGKKHSNHGGSIEYLYNQFHNKQFKGKRRNMSNYDYFVSSINEKDCIIKNKIFNVVKTSRKKCYKLIVNGYEIITTNEHKFYIGNNKYKRLDELTISDYVYISDGTRNSSDKNNKKNYYKEIYVKNHPNKKCRFRYIDKKYKYYRINRSHLVYEAYINGYTLDEYTKILNDNNIDISKFWYLDNNKFDIHHIDENTNNDIIDNLKMIEKSKHYQYHMKKNHNLYRFIGVKHKVRDIIYVGYRYTYDIKCYSPYNNYVANNFIVHNSGKTSLAYHLLARHNFSIHVPIEATFDVKRAKIFGNKKGQLFIRRAEYGEQCLETAKLAIQKSVPLICIDSVPAMKTKEEVMQDDMEAEDRRGRVAALLERKLPIMARDCEKYNSTLLFINQCRDDQAAMLFGDKDKTPGGRALRHYASIRIKIGRMKWIEVPNKDFTSNTAKKRKVGLIMKVKIIKSKVCEPLQETQLAMFFDRGFVPIQDVLEIRKEIMSKNNGK